MSSGKGITLGELAKKINAKLVGDPNKLITGINTLLRANEDEVSFLSRDGFIKDLKKSNAGAIIISEEKTELTSCNKLIGKDPYLLYARASGVFKKHRKDNISRGVSELSYISPSANISSSANIGPFCVIGEEVEIGEKVTLGGGVIIEDSVKIGNKTLINSNSTIYSSVVIGSNCIIHSGTVIGSDGLGFAKDGEKWEKIEHLGSVILGNYVEIGSNCSVDRGSLGNTCLNDQVKIDNQVHIAHNVIIGKATAIAANTAIAGSTVIGKNCTISGGCGIIDNLKITDSVHITALSLVTKSLNKPGTYTSGTALMEHELWKKNAVAFKRLKDIIKK